MAECKREDYFAAQDVELCVSQQPPRAEHVLPPSLLNKGALLATSFSDDDDLETADRTNATCFLTPMMLCLASSLSEIVSEPTPAAAAGSFGKGERTSTGKKYGGLVPKKPLISKDRERAFFDSADWALCKQGAAVNQQSTAAVETLRPKLQRTPHQQLPPRRPGCTSGRDNLIY